MKKTNSDIIRLHHIADNIEKILSISDHTDFQDFDSDWIKGNAIIRCFEIIGEATNNISQELKDKYPHVDWLPSKRMRNFLIHEYFMVDNIVIWGTIKNHLPKLKRDINQILRDLE